MSVVSRKRDRTSDRGVEDRPLGGPSTGPPGRLKDMRFRLVLLMLVLLALLVPTAGAGAADSHAPHGARLDWLPTDEWVMSAWLPFDEARLDVVARTVGAIAPPVATNVSAGSTRRAG